MQQAGNPRLRVPEGDARRYESVYENVHAVIGDIDTLGKVRCVMQQCGEDTGADRLEAAMQSCLPEGLASPLTFEQLLTLIATNSSFSSTSVRKPTSPPCSGTPDQTDVFDYIAASPTEPDLADSTAQPETQSPPVSPRYLRSTSFSASVLEEEGRVQRSGSLIQKATLQKVVSSFGLLFNVPEELSTMGIAGKRDAVLSREDFSRLCEALESQEGAPGQQHLSSAASAHHLAPQGLHSPAPGGGSTAGSQKKPSRSTNADPSTDGGGVIGIHPPGVGGVGGLVHDGLPGARSFPTLDRGGVGGGGSQMGSPLQRGGGGGGGGQLGSFRVGGGPASVQDLRQMLHAIGGERPGAGGPAAAGKKVVTASRVINSDKPAVRMGHTQVWRKNTKNSGLHAEGQRSEMIARGVFPPGAPRGKLQGVRPISGDYVRWAARVMAPLESSRGNVMLTEGCAPSPVGRYPRMGRPQGGLLNSLKPIDSVPPQITELYPRPLWMK